MKSSGSNWQILFHLAVRKDLLKLDASEKKRIKLAIETKLFINPDLYGIPLRGNLKRLWKLRVGDIRILFSINLKKIKILVIANRKDVYKIASRRNLDY